MNPDRQAWLDTPPLVEARGCVLLIEDEPLVRLVAADCLEDSGFVVVQTASAAEALVWLDCPTDDLSAVVVDVGLPDCRGDEFARTLRVKHRDLPIVIASGHDPAELRRAFGADPLVTVVGKPYELAMLQRTVIEAVERGSDPILNPRGPVSNSIELDRGAACPHALRSMPSGPPGSRD